MTHAQPTPRRPWSAAGVEVTALPLPGVESVLTDAALDFVVSIERFARARRLALLDKRSEIQRRLDAGWRPNFPECSRSVRESLWKISPVPEEIRERRVEITGPVTRKMIINALNSGADVFMADFEDSSSPTWENMVRGQLNLRDAVRRRIDFFNEKTGKHYRLVDNPAVLFVRPRGWHLEEKHVLVDGLPVSASIFDLALFLYHNAYELMRRGSAPYFYLPKLENHMEARLWNEIFVFAQDELGIPRGTIKATVLIETVLAAFEMDEILFELREHSAGLNCGRWDYIFSFIKKFRQHADFVLPDRASVGMDRHFLRSYSLLLIRTCHRRGAHAIGGMAAQIPIKNDERMNSEALERVRADKRREAEDGHDGTWVAHPALVSIAREEFDAVMPDPNQIHRLRDDVDVTAADLLKVPAGTISDKGLRQNLNVGVLYLEAWLGGVGCVPLYHLMEDAATAEISRTQVWQWIRHGVRMDDGQVVDAEFVRQVLAEELEEIRSQVGEERFATGRFRQASELFENLIIARELTDFLTQPAYEQLHDSRKTSNRETGS